MGQVKTDGLFYSMIGIKDTGKVLPMTVFKYYSQYQQCLAVYDEFVGLMIMSELCGDRDVMLDMNDHFKL